jgi:GNAT superfamily N-acetyltransferase
MTPSIERADVSAAAVVTALSGELLEEIQAAIGERVFSFDAAWNQTRLEEALETGRCVVFLARGRELGSALLAAAREHGRRQGWSRLEVTTPPLPAFSRTLGFYEREGFAVSGGRKLRCLISGAQES